MSNMRKRVKPGQLWTRPGKPSRMYLEAWLIIYSIDSEGVHYMIKSPGSTLRVDMDPWPRVEHWPEWHWNLVSGP